MFVFSMPCIWTRAMFLLNFSREKILIHFEYSQSSLRRTAKWNVWCYDTWCFPIEKAMERALADSLESNLNQENEAELQTFCSTSVQDSQICFNIKKQ